MNWGGAHQDGLVPAGLDKLHRERDRLRRIVGVGPQPRPAHVRARHVRARTTGHAEAAGRRRISGKAGRQPGPGRACPRGPVYQADRRESLAAGRARGHAELPPAVPGAGAARTPTANGPWYRLHTGQAQHVRQPPGPDGGAAGSPTESLVIGYDLKNEPRPATFSRQAMATRAGATGSTGADPGPTYSEQPPAASRAAQTRAADPAKLFFCEGLSYAADLTQRRAPSR